MKKEREVRTEEEGIRTGSDEGSREEVERKTEEENRGYRDKKGRDEKKR